MTTYTYLYADEFKRIEDVEDAINTYVNKKQLTISRVVEEQQTTKINWQKREIGTLMLEGEAKKGDAIVVYEATDLARSTCQLLEVLLEATRRSIDIHFVKYDELFKAQEVNKLADLLRMMQHIESDFISRRTTDALARRRAAGLPLGRPKGRKNKNLKLDKCRKDIVRYLDLGISKASIAKLVKCHPQTLYDWIDRHNVPDKRPRKPRKRMVLSAITSNRVLQAA
jgi:DNA invertase Pin-like site-specific DNA recombinase